MKFTRRFLLSLSAVIFYGIWQKYSPKSLLSQNRENNSNDTIPGIDPKPQRPKITNIEPAKTILLKDIIEPVKFIDDTVPKKWLYKTPVKPGDGAMLSLSLQEENQDILETLKELPKEQIIANSFPDFTDAIDLKKLGNNKPQKSSLFYTVISFDQPQLFRVCHGAIGLNVKAVFFVNNQLVKHGELIQVNKGLYPIIIEAYHGEKTRFLPWNMAHLAPRFTTVTETEIEEVYQWQLSQWQQTIDMAKANDERLLAAIQFDSKTIQGKEGFFQVGQSINGKWWFIDPQGKVFYHRGCTGLNAGGMGGRRANLPPVPKNTVKTWVNYLKEWGFNAMGSWTTSEFFDQNMAFTEIIETYYEKPWLVNKFPDVWNPQWAENVDKKCQKLCTPLKNNKMLLGYFLDNERGFMEMTKSNERIIANAPTYRYDGPIKSDEIELPSEPKLNPKGIGLLQFCLSQKQDIPAAQKAWEFVLTRYSSLENLGKAWQINIKSKESIKELTLKEEIIISDNYQQDNYQFIKEWVEQYYRICTKKIRKYDPDHLILGCRWGSTPGKAVLEVEKEWSDVVSRNNYRANFYEIFDDFYQQVKRPILNGEISTWSDHYTLFRNPIEPPGGYEPDTRQKIKANETMNRIFSHPGVLGYTKYRWHGNDDKLWSNEPLFNIINPLRQANYRSVSIATFWDQPPQKDYQSLRGQIFITLLNSTISQQILKPARIEDEPSVKISRNHLAVGLICEDNQWQKTVYGEGIKGEVTDSKINGNNYQLTIKIQIFPTLFSNSNAEGEYQLNLLRNHTKLEGTFIGTYNRENVSGKAIAYVHRPVTTVRY
ncbi:MAG: beta-galactosidase [Crocosphaera sp.]|nr:beta-galactosidase [Crocosphaera sp.]